VNNQHLIAIGGGSLENRETWDIDREILRAAGTRRPRALFIPTASSDSPDYWGRFQRIYGEALKCRCEVLWLLGSPPEPARVRRMIREADIIYVGGGNTLKMMRRWRHLGVDKLLGQARRRGTVLCGISAGANCWFAHGSSDSMKFYNPDDWDYIRVRGLGFLPGVCCPHYHGERREQSFAEMVRRQGGVGIALNDGAALQVNGERFRVLTSNADGRAYRVLRAERGVRSEPLPLDRRFRPIQRLFDPSQDITP
jgi:dipeptidase E